MQLRLRMFALLLNVWARQSGYMVLLNQGCLEGWGQLPFAIRWQTVNGWSMGRVISALIIALVQGTINNKNVVELMVTIQIVIQESLRIVVTL